MRPKKSKQPFTSICQFIWQVVTPYHWWYLLIFQATVVGGGYLIINNYAIKLVVDAFSTEQPIEMSTLSWPIGIFILAQIGHHVSWRLSEYAIWRVESPVYKVLLLKSYDYVQYHSYAYFQTYSSGMIISKLKGILEGFNQIFINLYYKTGLNFLTMLFSIFSLLIIDTRVFIFMLVWSILAIAVMYPSCLILSKLSDNLADSKHQVMGMFSDNITNIFSLFYFAKRQSELANLRKKISKSFIPNLQKLNKYFFILSVISSILYWFMLIFVFLFMIWLRKNAEITTGDFVFVIITVLTIADVLWIFTENTFELMKEMGDFKSCFSILVLPHESVDLPTSKPFNIKSATIQFKDVSFKYGNDDYVFEHLNLLIPAGQKIGIVGQSGAGKSTLMSLLLKNFLPISGHLMIDGHSIDDFNSDSLRSQVALIPQDIMLFNRTIAENIGYAKKNATLDEIKRAASFANIDTFIDSLPARYDTVVGERGVKLSGGQRQRIAIARAILKNAPIVILDEATSSLDTITEQEIQCSIESLFRQKNTTVIAIAHRLSSIRHMDRIIVMEGGKIIEDGTFSQLLAKKQGYFKTLWSNQSNGMIL